MEPRAAATVIVLRDGADGLEVFMVKRPLTAAFMPGFLVFPGGAVDPDDGQLATGRSFCAAARCAAIRELFEEAGILLARDPATGAVVDDRLAAPIVTTEREKVCRGERGFQAMLADHGLVPACELLVPLARWITPPGGSRRFDTRFFAVSAATGQSGSHDGDELIHSGWFRPPVLLADGNDGRAEFATPTRVQLDRLAGFANVADAIEGFRSTPIPVVTPVLADGVLERDIRYIRDGEDGDLSVEAGPSG